jgi:7,8-dihydroneopterin aldolase/epimerase/oxygenase
MDSIIISDLEVTYRVGVPDNERRYPQRLLVSVEMHDDFAAAVRTDDLNQTVDYFEVSQRLLNFGEGKEWKLIEKLAEDLARMVLVDFGPLSVSVEVKKFVVPQAQHVAVRVKRDQAWLKGLAP